MTPDLLTVPGIPTNFTSGRLSNFDYSTLALRLVSIGPQCLLRLGAYLGLTETKLNFNYGVSVGSVDTSSCITGSGDFDFK